MNMLLFGLALGSGGMLIWPTLRRALPGAAPQIGALESVQLINRRDALVLDVRSKADFSAARIPNSRNIPLEELDGRLREIEKFKSRPLIINFSTGGRAAAACASLTKQGFA